MTQEFVTLPREVVEQAQMWIPLLAEIAGLDPETTAAEFSEFAEGRPASEFTIAGVITALRAALEQPQVEQEPVAWLHQCNKRPDLIEMSFRKQEPVLAAKGYKGRPLIFGDIAHPQPKREPLTDMQKMMCWSRATHDADVLHKTEHQCLMDYASEIEAAHNIK